MEAFPGGKAIQDWERRGRIGCKNSGVAQSKGGRWGGSKDMEGDGKDPVNS